MPKETSKIKTSCRCSNSQCTVNLYARILFEKMKPQTATDMLKFYNKVDMFPQLELQRIEKLNTILSNI